MLVSKIKQIINEYQENDNIEFCLTNTARVEAQKEDILVYVDNFNRQSDRTCVITLDRISL